MGGRSYHPHLGRFFSPDPLVVSPLDAQAYNRYAYVLNRPLVLFDPTGFAPAGVGSDGGSNSATEGLPYHCDHGQECQRYLVVADPDGGSSLEQWNHMLAWFESHNGPGQGGPGFGSRGNGYGHPGSPNGVRHGNDHGQPGGTPVFTIAVTEDMCAEIAACSGRQSKRGPVYIWHAPIDDWAETAVDIATDFIPGVAQAKTAYDAYQRIQNGEDTVDVLMAAGGDALLGLIPGGRGAKRLGKAADKAEDVADAAGDVQQSYQIIDGVRRSKATEIAGQQGVGTGRISAQVVQGGKVTGTVEVEAGSLLSPKPSISTASSGLGRWINTLGQTLSGSKPPPIQVQPGSTGTPIRDVLIE
jgi:hypothetical protein